MENIKIGQGVQIKRTDGRVHTAVVIKKNEPLKYVTVEWYEGTQIKAKELDLRSVYELNPFLQRLERKATPDTSRSANPNISYNKSATSIMSRYMVGSTLSTTDYLSPPNTGISRSRLITKNTGRSISATSGIAGDNILNPTIGTNNSTSTTRCRTATNIAARSASATGVNTSTGAGASNIQIATNSTNNASSIPTGSRATDIGTRRSCVVREVERLKENREKRRVRHEEIKREKSAQRNADPDNPNWETAKMIRDYQKKLHFNPLVDGQAYENHQITVCVRKRPLSRKEVSRKEIDVISVPRKDMLIVHEPRNKVDLTKFLENHKFRFDYTFDDRCDNAMVYKYTAKPLVHTIFEGGMATCFAYGQTGSGKTHTMGGEFQGTVQDCANGVYAMAAKDVFDTLHSSRYRSLNLVVYASFFEIYSGKVFDLLANKHKLSVLEDGRQRVQVVGLTEQTVSCVADVLELIQQGNRARTSGQTSANSNSSRSHAVFQIVLRAPSSKKVYGKFSFIDLAGNERGADNSTADRQTRMEGAEINKSLLALKECIRALGRQSSHLPFRGSTLTQVLRDSFIGTKNKTCMIAMISPGMNSCEHTLNTLRYADRVKELVAKDVPHVSRADGTQFAEQDKGDKMANDSPKSVNDEKQNSPNEHDRAEKLAAQQSAIDDVQQTEAWVVDQHRAVNEFIERFIKESVRLYKLAGSASYDQEAYCNQCEVIFSQLAKMACGSQNMFVDFRNKLIQKEALSMNSSQEKQ